MEQLFLMEACLEIIRKAVKDGATVHIVVIRMWLCSLFLHAEISDLVSGFPRLFVVMSLLDLFVALLNICKSEWQNLWSDIVL